MNDFLIPLGTSDNKKDEPLFTDCGDYRIGYIDLIEDIDAPSCYAREFEILRTARKTDKVFITINTGGGYLSTAIQFIDAMDECKGSVVARLVGDGFSAGSLIFLAAPHKEVGRFGSLMLHRESGGIAGKGSDTERQMEYQKKFMGEVYREVYSDYLSETDMNRLMDGTDLWFSASETKNLVAGTFYKN